LTILESCYCKKQIDVSFLCVCPLIDDKLRHNIVKVAVEPRAAVLIDLNSVGRTQLSRTNHELISLS